MSIAWLIVTQMEKAAQIARATADGRSGTPSVELATQECVMFRAISARRRTTPSSVRPPTVGSHWMSRRQPTTRARPPIWCRSSRWSGSRRCRAPVRVDSVRWGLLDRLRHLKDTQGCGSISRPRKVRSPALRRRPTRHNAWIPFGGGTRRCVGAAFANMEMDVVLRTILRHFAIETTIAAGEKWHSRGVAFTPKNSGPHLLDRFCPRRKSRGRPFAKSRQTTA